jgi:hypothetical protein
MQHAKSLFAAKVMEFFVGRGGDKVCAVVSQFVWWRVWPTCFSLRIHSANIEPDKMNSSLFCHHDSDASLWSAVAKRSVDTAFAGRSGILVHPQGTSCKFTPLSAMMPSVIKEAP